MMEQGQHPYGSSAARMFACENHRIGEHCFCFDSGGFKSDAVREHIQTYNHLLFDFDTHRMTVEEQPSEAQNLFRIQSQMGPLIDLSMTKTSHFRVNIEKLAEQSQGFNHASCQLSCPEIKLEAFSLFDYTYLTHVNLTIFEQINHVLVLATYGGIAVL